MLLPLFSTKPRRYQAIYYLLIGKRTVSNLSAGLTYQLLPYFHFYPKLSQTDYQAALKQLQKQHYLKLQSKEQTAVLTAAGQLVKTQLLQQQIWPQSFNYWRDGDWQEQWERLLLSVQVISHYQHQIKQYLPLATQPLVQQEIRRWFYRCGRPQSQQFVTELLMTTQQLSSQQSSLLANSLRSQTFAGLTDFQLAEDLALTVPELRLSRIEALSQFLQIVQHLPQDSVLRQVFAAAPARLADATMRTYQLWQSQYSWAQICQRSFQKPNTLLEHLLEAAILIPDFDFDNPKLVALIQQDPERYFVQRLRIIRQQRGEDD